MKDRRQYGAIGEAYAEKLLSSRGYKILDRNFRCFLGEIDLVAQDADTLVFVEVKTRSSGRFGAPEEAVSPRKIQKIAKVGQFYCLTHPSLPQKLRIDVVALKTRAGEVVSCKLIRVS